MNILVAIPVPVEGAAIQRALLSGGHRVERVASWQDAVPRMEQGGIDILLVDARGMEDGALAARMAGGLYLGSISVLITAHAGGALPEGVMGIPPAAPSRELMQAVERIAHERSRRICDEALGACGGCALRTDSIDGAALHEDGSWSRPIEGGHEVGMDLGRWLAPGEMVCVEYLDIDKARAGQPYARVLLAGGSSHDLLCPVDGIVAQRNDRANEAIAAIIDHCPTGGWTLWLIRILSS